MSFIVATRINQTKTIDLILSFRRQSSMCFITESPTIKRFFCLNFFTLLLWKILFFSIPFWKFSFRRYYCLHIYIRFDSAHFYCLLLLLAYFEMVFSYCLDFGVTSSLPECLIEVFSVWMLFLGLGFLLRFLFIHTFVKLSFLKYHFLLLKLK